MIAGGESGQVLDIMIVSMSLRKSLIAPDQDIKIVQFS